jgi:hypothetical protein
LQIQTVSRVLGSRELEALSCFFGSVSVQSFRFNRWLQLAAPLLLARRIIGYNAQHRISFAIKESFYEDAHTVSGRAGRGNVGAQVYQRS